MPKTQVTLTDEKVQGFIAEKIESGDFDNADDVVTDTMRRFALYQEKRAEWNAMIDEGIADADRGDMVDGETFLRGRIEHLKAQL